MPPASMVCSATIDVFNSNKCFAVFTDRGREEQIEEDRGREEQNEGGQQ